MAYTPINFRNKQSGGTPVSAANLNHMEDGIRQAHDLVPTDSGSVGQVLTKTASGTSWQDADNLPEGGTEGQVLTKTANDGAEWTDAGNPTDTQVAEAVGDWLEENITTTSPVVDTSLSITGAAADAKKTGDEISSLKSALEQVGGGGQPSAVTLASDMMDTEKNYLYLGNETGYDYGYVYVYINDAWTKTTLYGKGQSGADGYSPSVSVASTSTGVTITATDKNGTTTANVSNGTATQAQVDAWLDAHPEATTTVEDGSISKAKLESELASNVMMSTKYYIDYEVAQESESVNICINDYIKNNNLYVEGEQFDSTTGATTADTTKNRSVILPAMPGTTFRLGAGTYMVVFDASLTVITTKGTASTNVSYTIPNNGAFIGLYGATSVIPRGDRNVLLTYANKLVTKATKKIDDDVHVEWTNVDNKTTYIEKGTVTKDKLDEELIRSVFGSVKYSLDYVSVQESDSVNIDLNKYIKDNNLYVEGEKFDKSTGETVTATDQNRSVILPVIPSTQITIGTLKTLIIFDLALNVIDSVTTQYSKVNYTVPENGVYLAMFGASGNFPATSTSVNITYTNKLVKVANKKANDLHVEWANVDNKDIFTELTGGEISRILAFNSVKTVNQMRHAFRIASFNTYVGNRNRWTELKNFLQPYGIDIIGFQEVHTPAQANSSGLTFAQALSSWHLSEFAVIETEDVPTNCRPVAATAEFEVVSTEETKYTTQSNYGHRHFTKTQLKLPRWKDKKSSENFMISIYNTQLEVGTSASNNSTRLSQINQLLAEVANDTNPFVVILGDFNEMSTSMDAYNAVKNAGFTPQLLDTSTPTAGRGFYDFIFVNERMSIVDDDVIPYDLHNNISDHDLVFADVVFDYSNLIAVKTSLPNCTLSGGTYWLDRRQTEPVVYTVTADEGYTVSSIATGQGDNDLTYDNGAVVLSGNTVTITPNLVVGDVWINVTTTANS